MIVKSLALSDFRNYDLQELSFHQGINIFMGITRRERQISLRAFIFV